VLQFRQASTHHTHQPATVVVVAGIVVVVDGEVDNVVGVVVVGAVLVVPTVLVVDTMVDDVGANEMAWNGDMYTMLSEMVHQHKPMIKSK